MPDASAAFALGDATTWARSFGGRSEIGDLAIDANDDVVVAGTTSEPFEIAGHELEPLRSYQGYVAKLSRSGEYVFSQLLTTGALDHAPRVATLPEGSTAVAVAFGGRLGLAGRDYDAPLADGVAVFVLDASGQPRWVRILPGFSQSPAPDVATDSMGGA